ncbi:MAG: metallophosphoesterase, partial [Trebonia sp.]
MRARTFVSLAAVGGTAAIGYASVIERNWFALRELEVPVLSSGAAPLRVLHVSDLHLTPGRHKLMSFVRSLAALEPDLVVNTGDTLASPRSVTHVLESFGPLLERPGVFVYGSNDLWAPKPGNPARYLWRTSSSEHDRREPDLPTAELGEGMSAAGWLDLNNRRGRIKA